MIMGISAAILFAMRIVSKAAGHIPWGHDDSLILAVFVCRPDLLVPAAD